MINLGFLVLNIGSADVKCIVFNEKLNACQFLLALSYNLVIKVASNLNCCKNIYVSLVSMC
jgi:hypothetical protein